MPGQPELLPRSRYPGHLRVMEKHRNAFVSYNEYQREAESGGGARE